MACSDALWVRCEGHGDRLERCLAYGSMAGAADEGGSSFSAQSVEIDEARTCEVGHASCGH